MMIDAFANHITAHLGRHLLYWAVSSVTASSTSPSSESAESRLGRLRSINLKLSELFIKFQGPLERGVQVLDNLLTLDEADFNGYWGTSHAHSYEPEIRQHSDEPTNREVLLDNDEQEHTAAAAEDGVTRARPSERRRFRGHHQHDRRIDCRRKMETLNSANGLLLSPPHNNSGHLNQRHNNAIEAAASRSASGAASSSGSSQAGSSSSPSSSAAGRGATGGGGGVEHNIQITQPISAPSSPLGSPGAIGSSTALFCMPSAISMSVGGATQQPLQPSGHPATHNMAAAAAISNSGSFVCSVAGSMTNPGVDTSDPNWQATKSSVLERNAAMFNNELMSDVCFKVGEDFDTVQTIPAHKYILATGSSVFYAMFYGGLAEHQNEIKVPDVEPSAFLTLLRYLYCDEIQLEPDNILATLYAAKKYIVPHLARACVNYLEVKLTAKNACLLLSQSRLFEEPELMQRCWEVIDAQPEMAIKSEDFVDIDLKTFESILSRETLNCKEIHLFEAALNWALNACQKMNIEPSPANQRSMLGQALHLIRIPTMSLEEFANGVAQTGILSAQETIDTFLHFTAEQKPSLGFPTRPRAGLKTQVCHRFQSCAYRTNQWRYRGRCDSIQFSVDRRIFIVGFGLYGSSTGAAHYNVRIELKRLGRTLAQNDTKFYSDGSSSTFHVFFDNPIQIEPECYYTASVILDGNELSFFGQEGMFEVCMGNVTFQFQCSSESTNGTGVQGGQIPELIFYGPTPTQPLNSPRNSICHSPSVGALAAPGSSDSNGGILGNCDDLLTSGESAGPATNAQASAALGQGPMSPGS